jgi:hypothetical protein
LYFYARTVDGSLVWEGNSKNDADKSVMVSGEAMQFQGYRVGHSNGRLMMILPCS